MQLYGSTKNKITKDENGENVPHLQIIEIVLIHFNILNNKYQHGSRALFIFFLTQFWLGFFIDVKWLGGIIPPPPPPSYLKN